MMRAEEALRTALLGQKGEEIMAHLATLFDHPAEFHDSPLRAAYLEGQRAVFEYIEEVRHGRDAQRPKQREHQPAPERRVRERTSADGPYLAGG